MSARRLVDAFTFRPLSSAGRKPSFCTVMLYVPAATLGAVYSPESFVVRFTATLVAVLAITTLARGMTAPEESVMVPEMVPRSDCASSRVAQLSRLRQKADLTLPLEDIQGSPFPKATLH